MTFGQYIDENFRKEYNGNKIRIARETLKDLPNLENVICLDKFLDAQRIENPIIVYLSEPKRWNNWLEYIEKIFDDFIPLIKKDKKEWFISMVNNPNFGQNYPVFIELIVFGELVKIFGKKNVIPYPSLSNGKETDFFIKKNDGIFVEATILGERKVEKSLRKLFDKCSKELFSKIPSKFFLKLDVDTSKLIWKPNKDGLNFIKSKELILNSFDDLGLLGFIKYINQDDFFFFLSDLYNLGDKDKTVRELSHYLEYYGDLGKFLKKNINKPEISLLLDSKLEKVINSPIKSICFSPAKRGIVEVHSLMQYPSESARLDKKSFLRQLSRKIKEKLDEKQREPGHINLLFILAQHWTLHGWSKALDDISDLEFSEIEKVIKEVLERNKDTTLSGIILFESDPSKIRIMENPGAELKIPKDLFY